MGAFMTRAWYHIVVIGTDLPGLVFAALAARRGYRVCVLGQGAAPVRYRHEGHWFLGEREVFCGVGSAPAIGRVFAELGLGFELKNRPQPIEPALQIAMPGVRLDFTNDSRVLAREIDREFPGQWDALAGLDEECRYVAAAFDPLTLGELALPPDGFRERSRFKAVLRGVDSHLLDLHDAPFGAHFAHPGFQKFAHAVVDQLADVGTEHLPRHMAMRIWRSFRDGFQRFPGGLDGLKDMFVGKLRDQSGDHRPDAYAIQLDIKRSKVVSVGLAERGEALGCELVVLNASPERLGPLLGILAEPPRAHRVIVNIAVDPRFISPCMAPEMLLFGPDAAGPLGDTSWWLSRPGFGPLAGAEGRPGPGIIQMSTIARGRRLPALLEDPSFLRAAALDALRTVVPWLDDGLRAVHLPPPIPLSFSPDPRAAGVVATPWPRLPFNNALATGAGAAIPFGLEGACVNALVALHRLTRRLPIKGAIPNARL